jgi:hypothetical protein
MYQRNLLIKLADLGLGLALGAAGLISGCAARLNQFNTFAQAGTTYVAASQSVIQAAGTAAVNTDSALLIKLRPDLDESQRKKRVTESDTLLKQRLQVLELIGAHGKLLQAYFEALAALSDPKATDSVGSAAQGVYDSLAKMSPTLKNAKMGTTSVSSFIPTVTAPIVATFKAHALNEELKARSGAIVNELALQDAAFSAIEAELKTDTQEQQNLRETDSVNQFTAGAPLPPEWASQRLVLLSTPASVASADAAAKAAAHLLSTFTALVENRLDSAGFASLTSDISNMIATAQNIQNAAK